MKDSKERFTETAADYHRYRPSYPNELIDWILTTAAPVRRVADVGCGTGISTRLFAERGLDVVGIDPNEEMLKYATGARYRKGDASATGLPDASVDLVMAAQAFHWFDLPLTFREFRRILRSGGWCAAFWNLRASGAFMDPYDALLRRYSSEYAVLRKPRETIELIEASPEVSNLRQAEFRNAELLDREHFLGRVRSSSYVVHGVARRDEFESALNALFDAHQKDGRIEFAYQTVAVMWELPSK
jgi:ubiquinone/menaquinone biosynthesis C-methylase UbiE